MKFLEAKGAQIPALGLGTWELRDEVCRSMVAEALAVGYRHIDTGHMYRNEGAVGDGIRDSGVSREDIFLTTKVWQTDIRDGDLQRSAKQSLKLMGQDHVDLLLIHWPNSAIPLADSIGAMNDAQRRGHTRHIGVSNFTAAQLREAVELSDSPIVCNQIEVHPYLSQRIVKEAAYKLGVAIIAYCPLFRGGPLFQEPAIMLAAAAHGKTAAQIVLRWHIQQDNCGAIPCTTKTERLSENLDVFGVELTSEEMAAISALGDQRRRLCDFPDLSPEWDAA